MQRELGTCSDWKAWYTPLSAETGTLHVSGRCKFPTAGFSVWLRPKLTQGINPRIYLLERHVSGPIGRKDKIETVVEVRYSEHTRLLYDLVHILPDGIDVRIERTA